MGRSCLSVTKGGELTFAADAAPFPSLIKQTSNSKNQQPSNSGLGEAEGGRTHTAFSYIVNDFNAQNTLPLS